MLGFVGLSEVQILWRRLLRFLDEGMQQHHLFLVHTEQHARDAAVRDVAAEPPTIPFRAGGITACRSAKKILRL